MRKFIQNKLWRDKAPELMENMGSKIHVKELSDDEYCKCLQDKLLEEITEVKEALDKGALLEEMADVLEVLDALCKLHGIDKDELGQVKQKKFLDRGGFYDRKFVTVAEHKPDSFGERYCLKQPEKYPEIA